MFLIYVNDFLEGVKLYINLFTDDARLTRKIRSIHDCNNLQNDLDRLQLWSDICIGNFNLNKWKIIKMRNNEMRPCHEYDLARG